MNKDDNGGAKKIWGPGACFLGRMSSIVVNFMRKMLRMTICTGDIMDEGNGAWCKCWRNTLQKYTLYYTVPHDLFFLLSTLEGQKVI
jgi:hypothetical protein